jgi:hypothetical protein
MIVGVDERIVVRQDFEDEFVARLTMRGVLGVPSYRHFTLSELYEEEAAVKAKIKELKIPAVLVARIIDRETVKKYYHPEEDNLDPRAYRFDPAVPYRSWQPYFSLSYAESQRLQPIIVGAVVRLESNLYDAATGELRWSALSETFVDNMADRRKNTQSAVAAMLNSLRREGMIR